MSVTILFSQKGEIEPIKLEKNYTINGYLHTKKLKTVNYDQFLVKKIHGGEINIYVGFPELEAFCSEKPGRAPEWATDKHPANCPHSHGQVGVSHAHLGAPLGVPASVAETNPLCLCFS